ncbi:glycosyltransferase involved in cell wall biosynthesis [Catalinimonas alkaloidigena]|uniref:glycosyltransferase family 4 protein n=1 Tax=Catalinimonas alkaloidigena TaxID=1075417 RepID=UPI002404C0D1|nr:glycosyltransferase family 4 protein [Catalinimonas alkaloidigena]MDF9795196.1 glycosyltransferase involved in cell wall biosynthesis [Catalinimonas alkaloidigena]
MNLNKPRLIVFLCPYPEGGAPSQRFRFEQYLQALNDNGFQYRIEGFLDEKTNRILYQPGQTAKKLLGVLKGFLRRLLFLPTLNKADYVFIHREATPVGPPIVEWIIAKILKKKIIYDFDDAIWLRDTSGINSFMAKIKWQQKVASICRWSYKVSAGNNYLYDFAKQYCQQIVLNPTTIDTEHYHNQRKNQHDSPLTIGWTGSHSTMKYLYAIEDVLQQLEKVYAFRFVVISNRPPEMKLKNLHFIPWKEATEIDDLLQLHIGIMPLPDDLWAKGKCGFKALQYLSLGIPALVSPVGVNAKIVAQGVNGYLCSSDQEWYDSLSKLLNDQELRTRMGAAGRNKVEEEYSVKANTSNFLGLFK